VTKFEGVKIGVIKGTRELGRKWRVEKARYVPSELKEYTRMGRKGGAEWRKVGKEG